MEYGMGIWWDRPGPGGYKDWRTHPSEVNRNFHSPERLEHVLYNALTVSDRYVWVFGAANMAHSPSVWWNSAWPRDGVYWVKPITKEYIDAFRNARKPHDVTWKPAGKDVRVNLDGAVLVIGDKITGNEENLLKNADFSDWPDASKAPNSWRFLGKAQISGESASLWRDEASAKVGPYAAQLGMATPGETGHISLDQIVPTESLLGQTVTFGAWVKSNQKGTGDLIIESTEVIEGALSSVLAITEAHPGDDKWRFMTVTAEVPEEISCKVRFMIRAFVKYSPE